LSPKQQQQQQQRQHPQLQQQHSQPLSPKQQQQRRQNAQRQPSQDIGRTASWPDHIDGLLRIASGMGCSDSSSGGGSGDQEACGNGLKVLLSSLTDDIYVTSERTGLVAIAFTTCRIGAVGPQGVYLGCHHVTHSRYAYATSPSAYMY
jgi:hypothetical protein